MIAWQAEQVGLARCFAIIWRTVRALVVPTSFIVDGRNALGGWGRRNAFDIFQNERSAQHGEVRFGYADDIRTAPLPSKPQRTESFNSTGAELVHPSRR